MNIRVNLCSTFEKLLRVNFQSTFIMFCFHNHLSLANMFIVHEVTLIISVFNNSTSVKLVCSQFSITQQIYYPAEISMISIISKCRVTDTEWVSVSEHPSHFMSNKSLFRLLFYQQQLGNYPKMKMKIY